MGGWHKLLDTISNSEILYEHHFWLQILGDHSRLILNALPVQEDVLIQKSKNFIILFDKLLDMSRKEMSDIKINEFTMQCFKAAQDLKGFKIYIISKQLINKIRINLPPTFINHMLNELNEYLKILNCYINSQPYAPNPLHHHLLWLLDGSGHADGIAAFLDMSEKAQIKKSLQFGKSFRELYLKAIEFKGFTRTGLTDFPALDKLNNDAFFEMDSFKLFLEEIQYQTDEKKLLGTLPPLVTDHMYREECYYQTKLSQTTKIKKPDCDPAKPRMSD